MNPGPRPGANRPTMSGPRNRDLDAEFEEYAANIIPWHENPRHGKFYQQYVKFLGGRHVRNAGANIQLQSIRRELLFLINNRPTIYDDAERLDNTLRLIHTCLEPHGIHNTVLRAVIAVWAAKGMLNTAFRIPIGDLHALLDWPHHRDHTAGSLYQKLRNIYVSQCQARARNACPANCPVCPTTPYTPAPNTTGTTSTTPQPSIPMQPQPYPRRSIRHRRPPERFLPPHLDSTTM